MHGAIIAGGAATRMDGAPKGLLAVGGRRILDRLVDAFIEALGALPLLVANAPEAAGWRGDLRVVPDRRPGLGTLGGLWTAVLEAPAPVVCAAWDMPFVPAGLLRELAEGLGGEGGDHDVCVPASGGRRGVEPLCAAYGPAAGPAMAAALDRGDLRAIAFHQAVRVNVLTEDRVRRFGEPGRLFFNVNTADDLVRANGMAP
ncbi:MAG TPA: molybdenum cofactor guanylyltransferase [Gemmatimonadales bacterium]|jgi:molybdopterin-guanine dinucleotide biosynthesis protein A|nr:molybdenum cofactor guanylyltransferase [Gemmatimonadales bacterium]